MIRRGAVQILGGAALAVASGCMAPTPPLARDDISVALPVARPAALIRPTPAPRIALPNDTTSDALTKRYAQVEQRALTHGLLRRDGGGVDTPYDADDLAENFLTIAFFSEHSWHKASLEDRRMETPLRRWDQPIRMRVSFGDDVPEARRISDSNALRAFSARLSRLSGQTVTWSEEANFHILIMNEAERRAAGPQIRNLLPGIDDASVEVLTSLSRSADCAVVTFSAKGAGQTHAAAIIRDELPPLMRLSCIHEELAQGLGLPNDSDSARPSIFNDNDEFALLTSHDEQLIKILYDPRLRSGMTRAQATPIVRQIARDLVDPAPET